MYLGIVVQLITFGYWVPQIDVCQHDVGKFDLRRIKLLLIEGTSLPGILCISCYLFLFGKVLDVEVFVIKIIKIHDYCKQNQIK